MNRRAARGEAIERRVQAHLVACRLRLPARDHRCRCGEIDLVIDDGEAVGVDEVGFRGRDDFGGAAVSVDTTKQRRLNRAAQDYLTRTARFDVAAVGSDEQIDRIKGAFDAA